MKRFTCILLLAACLGGGGLHAQDLLEVRRVELDSLVHVLRREFQPDIYFVKDPAEQATFTVSVLKSGTLLDGVKVDYQAGPETHQDSSLPYTSSIGTTPNVSW